MERINLPHELEGFRSKLELTVKPFVEIKTHLMQGASPTQSKFFGFPYLPKSVPYPTTRNGEHLYLLAQINFEETPRLEDFPESGILQFYIAGDGYYGLDYGNPTNQDKFRILYFPTPKLDKSSLITNFDFLKTIWTYENHFLPFWIFDSYTPCREECFALSFDLKSGSILSYDYRFDELIGSEIWNILSKSGEDLWSVYAERFGQGHRLGGNPDFCQRDPRASISGEEEYILLLQIGSDGSALEKIYIEWSDLGIGNFFIKRSDLQKLDFSKVLYNWDC